jgi:hypothetical protein
MDLDQFNSKSTFDDVINSGINVQSNVIQFVRKYLTDSFYNNITYDEIFMLLIGTITSLTVFIKHHYIVNKFVDTNLTPEDIDNLEELNYSIIFLQNVVMIIYMFYIINMMLNGKKHFIITRYSMLINYTISIITLSVYLYRSYK